METNLEQQTPKLNVTNVSSAVFGKDGPALGEESKIGKLSRILRTTRLKVNNLEKVVGKQEELIKLTEEKTNDNINKTKINAEKITRLKNILQTQKSDIGKKLPGSTEDNDKAQLNTTLSETNRILVEIQKQLAQDFGAREQEAKEESEDAKEATSKQRFKREETALEKSAKSIVSTAKKATKKIVSPLGNIFEKILAFIGILGKGIALNAAFKWFQDPENRKKITKFFNILKENWKLLRNILLTLGGIVLGAKILGAAAIGMKAIKLLASPAGIAALIALSAAKLVRDSGDASDRILKEKGIDPEKAKIPGSEENKKAVQALTEQASNPLTGGMLVPTLVQQTLGPDGKPKPRVKPVTDFAGIKSAYDIPFGIGRLFRMMAPDQYQEYLKQKASEAPEAPEARELGGPVTAGRTYLVGEKGPELFSPNIDGSIVNNMRTEKIYQMLASGKRGRTRIVNLPPQVIEGPKPEVNVNQGPATQAPRISSSNPFDGSRLVTPEIYGISA